MALVEYKEKTNTRRFASRLIHPKKNKLVQKRLLTLLAKHSGRSGGTVTVRHQGGRHKRFYRTIDFKRDKFGVEGVIAAFEYDPNRNTHIALVKYTDGDYRYILTPQGLKVGDKVVSGEKTEVKVGNAMKLKNIPIGTMVHNVELTPGRGGQLGRSAGTALMVQARILPFIHLKLPSSEIRMVAQEAMATIGVLGNEDAKNIILGTAGRSRHLGVRPGVRGTAMDPESHPHGGGEGRSGIGRKKPMTFYGRPAVGNTRTKKKQSNRYIVKRRK
ncbi:MAG: 50S ribosomal protein L2 [Candidatus Daviesbacteria bacterium]|nr:50S ribosomal protein L2 [Candidatus Daviesbacteria bacterium]